MRRERLFLTRHRYCRSLSRSDVRRTQYRPSGVRTFLSFIDKGNGKCALVAGGDHFVGWVRFAC